MISDDDLKKAVEYLDIPLSTFEDIPEKARLSALLGAIVSRTIGALSKSSDSRAKYILIASNDLESIGEHFIGVSSNLPEEMLPKVINLVNEQVNNSDIADHKVTNLNRDRVTH